MSTKATPAREPVLRRASGHPADDLPTRPGSTPQIDQTVQVSTAEPPAPPTPAAPAPAPTASITKTPALTPTPGEHGPADTYGIEGFEGANTQMHSARIRQDTKLRTEAAVDYLKLKARTAGGNAKLISLASVTDAALLEFIGRYAPEVQPYPSAQ